MSEPNQWCDDAAELAKMKILIIDDEPANIALLEDILFEDGYTRVEAIPDSKLALSTVRNYQPDLILLDLMMPPPDGFAILDSLRNEEADGFVAIVVLTADTSEETRQRALQSGASDFLLKPFDHTEVILRIRNLLRTCRAHHLLDNQRAALEDAVRERTSELRAVIAHLRANYELPPTEKLPR